jgi:peptide/nickel transport system ATP-binding protein
VTGPAGAPPPGAADAGTVASTAEAAEAVGREDARRERELPRLAVPGAPLLRVNNLRTHFRMPRGWVRAVDDVTFKLDHGEALGLAGESGCGKTTTALSLVRLLPANGRISQGSIKLFGIDLVPKTERQLARYRWREISMVFQGAMNALNPVKRIGDQIAEPIEVRLGQPREAASKRAGELLELVGIPRQRGSAYPHELSGGMRQRVALARALAPNPSILLMDEPFAALDAMTREKLYGDLQEIWRKRKKTILFVTHNVREACVLADRVVVMSPHPGRIVASFDVHLQRPRDINSPEIAQLATGITQKLKSCLPVEAPASGGPP